MKLTRDQLQIFCEVAVQAGEEIMHSYATGGGHWTKDDDSPLTEADLRADAAIRKGLECHFPGLFIWSEESVSQEVDSPTSTFFLVDPLDGTKEFLKRNGEFTVNIALVHQSKPVAGVVYAPALGELFYAAEGLGAWVKREGCEAHSLSRSVPKKPAEVLNVIGSRSHGSEEVSSWLQDLGIPFDLISVGSSLKFCRVAEGKADLYPRFGPTCQWDTAAAQAILEMAGGLVVDRAGQRITYGLNRPKLNPEFIALSDQSVGRAIGLSQT